MVFKADKLILIFGLLLIYSCTKETEVSPEEVVRQYQSYIDNNEFTKAANLSTPAERRRLEELTMMIGEDADSTILETEIKQIICQKKADTVICNCLMEDQYEDYPAEFVLIKNKGKWLIDIPREESIEYDEEIEQILDSLLNESL